MGQPRPYRKGAVPQCSPILGVPFYLCKTTKFDTATHVGRGLFLGAQPRPHPNGVVPPLPNFGVPFYLFVHSWLQNGFVPENHCVWT